jgi:hypothetical protein
MSTPVRRSRPWATRSCRDYFEWGWIDRPRCKACWGFNSKATRSHCDVCTREVAAIDGICRLCRRQASLIVGPDNKTRVDLTVAARTGQQLFIIGTLRPRCGPPAAARCTGTVVTAAAPCSATLHGAVAVRGAARASRSQQQGPTARLLTVRILECPGRPDHGAAWLAAPYSRLGATRHPDYLRGSPAGGANPGLDHHQLTHTTVPANHVLEVFEELDIFPCRPARRSRSGIHGPRPAGGRRPADAPPPSPAPPAETTPTTHPRLGAQQDSPYRKLDVSTAQRIVLRCALSVLVLAPATDARSHE